MEIEQILFLVLYQDARFDLPYIHNLIGVSIRTLRSWKRSLETGQNMLEIKEGRGRKKN